MTERRRNPLTGAWVTVCSDRLQRPWQGAADSPAGDDPVTRHPDCYLCPGNPRSSGTVNPAYSSIHVFDNDFSALAEATGVWSKDPLFTSEPVSGQCRVLCYSPRHDASLATLSQKELAEVIDCWCAETESLGAAYPWVQIFENRGRMMGCSSEHPHGQIWATTSVPEIPRTESDHQLEYLARHGTTLLQDYGSREMANGERVVCANSRWLVVVPFWATWPFETLVVARTSKAGLGSLDSTDRRDLTELLQQLLRAYNRLFDTPMPYSMGWHGLPGKLQAAHWIVHAHFYPPLLRSASVRKFMVGFEMLAEAQRDLTPEAAAATLRTLL